MRKTKVVLAKVLTAAMFISSFAGVQGITSEAAAKPKLSKKSVSITVGKTKKITVKNAKKYKVSWKMKSKKSMSLQKQYRNGRKRYKNDIKNQFCGVRVARNRFSGILWNSL